MYQFPPFDNKTLFANMVKQKRPLFLVDSLSATTTILCILYITSNYYYFTIFFQKLYTYSPINCVTQFNKRERNRNICSQLLTNQFRFSEACPRKSSAYDMLGSYVRQTNKKECNTFLQFLSFILLQAISFILN